MVARDLLVVGSHDRVDYLHFSDRGREMMSVLIKDGGPAFPCTEINGDAYYGTRGMTLRDHFAGLAMQSSIIAWKEWPISENAEWAYNMADAMLKERAK